jgi:hypothetical protein
MQQMIQQEFEQRQQKTQSRVRAVYAFTMGILLILLGLLLIFYRKLGFAFDIDPLYSGLFGGICILYGLFRVWRGYKSI